MCVCGIGVVGEIGDVLVSQVGKDLSFSFHQAIKPPSPCGLYLCCDLIHYKAETQC